MRDHHNTTQPAEPEQPAEPRSSWRLVVLATVAVLLAATLTLVLLAGHAARKATVLKRSSPKLIDAKTTNGLNLGLASVSCATPHFCVAVDYFGYRVTWNGAKWSSPTLIDLTKGFGSVSCASSSLCVALDDYGNALTWNGVKWSSPASIDTSTGDGPWSDSVSCPSPSFCAAVNTKGNVLTASSAPTHHS